jgi:ADP-ribose pyrophosphatase
VIKRWRLLSDKEAFRGRIFRYRQVRRESTTQKMVGDFDVLDFLNWVTIIALKEDGQVLLVRQYRQGLDEVTRELPGGAVHLNEPAIEAAKRELLEETGHIGVDWIDLGIVQPNPAIQTNLCHVFLAKDCRKIASPSLDPLEELEVESVSLQELFWLVEQGEIRHSLVLSALLLGHKYLPK